MLEVSVSAGRASAGRAGRLSAVEFPFNHLAQNGRGPRPLAFGREARPSSTSRGWRVACLKPGSHGFSPVISTTGWSGDRSARSREMARRSVSGNSIRSRPFNQKDVGLSAGIRKNIQISVIQ